jgi:hypothetical protein
MKTARARLLREFALIKLTACLPAQSRVLEPIKREQGALEPTQFTQCRGHTVLSRVGGQLTHDQRGRYRAGSDGGGDPQDC